MIGSACVSYTDNILHFMLGRTIPTLFATQNARNMYSQALVATGTGYLAGIGYSEWEQP